MQDLGYVFANFFTHKDFLVSAEFIPGTLYTPLHLLFEAVLLAIIFAYTFYLNRHRHLIKKTFTVLWVILLILEIAIIYWDSTAGLVKGLDLANDLSLYPCSIFLYTLPFAIWGHGSAKKIACGYISTLGMLGAVVNFLYPISRLTSYSCISFPGFHTFFFHGSMLFVYLVMMVSGYHRYSYIESSKELIFPCIASIIVSIPANMINYSPINADYMYFKGRFFLLAKLFPNYNCVQITVILYCLYIIVPALFYLPWFLAKRNSKILKETAEIQKYKQADNLTM